VKEESSFLKKRGKKLLHFAANQLFHRETRMLPATSKSFLVLFFRKELVSSTAAAKEVG
jgi:hypothetical protein